MTTTADHLRNALDGRWRDVKNQVRTELSGEVFRPHYTPNTVIARTKVAEQLKIMAARGAAEDGFKKEHGGNGDVGAAVTQIEMLAMSDLSLMVKAGVQWGLFGGAIENLGTERHHNAYVRKLIDLELLGCFAMTETGHGSDVQSLETTATYDPQTQEFVIDSPTPSSRKDYIGGAAQTARVAAVFAQLITKGEGHGVHCFVVPIRDDAGNDLPGVTTSDCHYKGGLPGVDNGRIQFDQVRIPRENLLNKYADVAEDGTYTSPIENKGRRFFTMLGTLIRGRVTVGGSAGAAARVALDIATRYALERRQFEAPGSENEVLIMDYLVHQRRLFPLIAKSYALQFAQNELVAKCHELQTAENPDAEEQRELESRAAGLKAANTWHATRAIQEAREACGGAGYLAENRLIALKADTDVFTTFEGDNHVLTQLVAKELLTSYADDIKGMSPVEWVRFAANFAGERVLKRTAAQTIMQTIIDTREDNEEEGSLFNRGTQVKMFEDREEYMLASVARRLQSKAKEMSPFEAFNSVQDHVLHTAQAHIDRIILEAFVAGIDACEDEKAREILGLVCDLYALSVIEEDKAWFVEHRFLSTERAKAVTRGINDRCRRLRPHAELLVDGFGIPEQLRYAEMLHPEHIPDADEHQEKDAVSSGTIEPK
ncbi:MULTISPECIES: acyl-CoA dehydrogenase family protein [Mycobacteriaceae]|uniref:acyl-CoA oxidase n=1 Tax=Mycolicibacterium neoaurum VKM Ac-1815D TaxID=700508 RepID=V5XFI0_MYCNE|nr:MULTISPECIES: acyl-CoA dehydrogenase [Mycobacteriaceae]AHC26456.1 acyl-CoA oxidase [Mycolicibacterium neoaurum VKM Ac-1815D]AMO06789.1 acyl-CoA oxidase [Mycolicibacterium neoaurum]AXK74844.1 acyl-CoA oxidase [Mycolicibacterium neoaurum]KJQ49028.1 acyl-CoA oxidase [Mycolicibacterium neoaurum]KUM08169.1 acyl-CoA oxidase [Mycolicibacterium neoaurum]